MNIKKACKLLNVSRSGYYKYLEHKPSARDIENGVLSTEIKKIFDEHKSRYGSLRITKVLEQNGIEVNRKRVARLMRMMGLYPKGTNYKYKKYHQNNAKEECIFQPNSMTVPEGLHAIPLQTARSAAH